MADLKFSIWESWADTFDQLGDESLVTLFRAMYRYAFKGVEPGFEPGTPEALVWPMVSVSVGKSVAITRRNHENGAKHVGKSGCEPNGKPNGKPKSEPNDKPSSKSGITQKKPEKKRIGKGIGIENLESFNSYSEGSGVADAEGSAPPERGEPRCPLCGDAVEVTGMPDPSYWWCPNCRDTYPEGKAEWR